MRMMIVMMPMILVIRMTMVMVDMVMMLTVVMMMMLIKIRWEKQWLDVCELLAHPSYSR